MASISTAVPKSRFATSIVTRAGSVSRAALAVHLSQPAMSRRIDSLEREIGVALFDRVPSGAPTSGEPFARAVEQQLGRCGMGDAEYIAIDSLTAQKRLIEADFGVGLMPTSAVEEELRLGTLRVFAIAAFEFAVPVAVIHRRNGYLSGAARRLLASLTDRA